MRDIYPGLASSSPSDLTAVGDQLVFAAADPAGGRELWVSDGTLAGTQPLTDIQPGPAHSNPSDLAVSGSRLYFLAYTDAAGYELWALPLMQFVYLPFLER